MTISPRTCERNGLDAEGIARIFNIPTPEDFAGNVEVLIELKLLGGRPTLDDIVRRSGMSKRTLQRRLATLGLAYGDLLRNSLQRRAIQLLQRSDLAITEITIVLGYSDPAHFTRAFEKWSGVSPSRWRDRARTEGGSQSLV